MTVLLWLWRAKGECPDKSMRHAQGPGNTMHRNQRVYVDVIIWKNFEIRIILDHQNVPYPGSRVLLRWRGKQRSPSQRWNALKGLFLPVKLKSPKAKGCHDLEKRKGHGTGLPTYPSEGTEPSQPFDWHPVKCTLAFWSLGLKEDEFVMHKSLVLL